MVSIIMLTHNAPKYVSLSLTSLHTTVNVDYEVIVLDNASDMETQTLLWDLKKQGFIDKLILESENTFFSRGNNLAFNFCNKSSEYVLFLNSDIEIKDPRWLEKMLSIHEPGGTALGLGMSAEGRFLADGYCILFDKKLYENFPMREDYEWWYSIAYTQCQLLRAGYSIKAVHDHEELLHHFGGKSGEAWRTAKGMKEKENLNLYDEWLTSAGKPAEAIFSLAKEIGSDQNTYNMLRGVSADNWCGPIVDFEILTREEGILELQGHYPFKISGNEIIDVSVNHKVACQYVIKEQSFTITVSTSRNEIVRVQLKSHFMHSAPDPDIRELCFVVANITAR